MGRATGRRRLRARQGLLEKSAALVRGSTMPRAGGTAVEAADGNLPAPLGRNRAVGRVGVTAFLRAALGNGAKANDVSRTDRAAGREDAAETDNNDL